MNYADVSHALAEDMRSVKVTGNLNLATRRKIMRNKILTVASVIALMGTASVVAQAQSERALSNAEATTTGNITEDAKTAWGNMKSDASEAYYDIKAVIIGDETVKTNEYAVIDSRQTATGIIGHSVYNETGEKVATVTDIILDATGKADMVVVSDSTFMGMGKTAAFNYNDITRIDKDGDVIMPLTENIIDNAKPFSYDRNVRVDNTVYIPSDAYSVSTLLKGRLLNQRRESVADIENIHFKNGRAEHLIVGFDKTLGFGGEQALLAFNDAKIMRNGDALDFQLSAEKAMQFEVYKNRAIN